MITVQVGGQKMWRLLLQQVWSEVHSLTADVCKILVYRLIKIVSLCVLGGSKAIANNITVGNMRMILASFLEKCPEQYTM